MGISIFIFIEIQKVQTVKYMIGAKKITVKCEHWIHSKSAPSYTLTGQVQG